MIIKIKNAEQSNDKGCEGHIEGVNLQQKKRKDQNFV